MTQPAFTDTAAIAFNGSIGARVFEQAPNDNATFDYAALGAKLRKEADRREAFAKRASWPESIRNERLRHITYLRHIARDCEDAAWGCEASARSVEEFLDGGAF